MNCRRAGKMIPLYAGGELSDKQTRRFGQHLEECSDCRKMAEEFRDALAALRTAAQRDEHDWPEAEWKSLMKRIRTQPPPHQAVSLGLSPIPAWAYGAAALLIVGLAVFILRARLFPPAPVHPTEIVASTELQPGRSLELSDSRISPLRQDIPFLIRSEKPRAVEPDTLTASSARGQDSQDLLSMTLVSQETGLKMHWTFNRNFEWNEEKKQ